MSKGSAPHSPVLAREGWTHIALAVAVAASVHYFAGGVWAAPLWLLVIFVVQFFRDPARVVPTDAHALVCPADGRVIVVDEVQDPYLKRPARRVSIFMNVFNVHANRSPVAGTIQQRWYSPGKFFNAALDKAASENERNALWVKTDNGMDVVFVQVAGLIARRIFCYVDKGDRLARGQRYGFIRFGSRVDIYLPIDCKLQVSLGDKVSGGRDILGFFVH